MHCLYYDLLNHSGDRHLGCCHSGALKNNAINISVPCIQQLFTCISLEYTFMKGDLGYEYDQFYYMQAAFKLLDPVHILVIETLHGISVIDFNHYGKCSIAPDCVLMFTYLISNRVEIFFICLCLHTVVWCQCSHICVHRFVKTHSVKSSICVSFDE